MQYRRPVSLLPGPGYHRWMDPTLVRAQTLNLKKTEVEKDITSEFSILRRILMSFSLYYLIMVEKLLYNSK